MSTCPDSMDGATVPPLLVVVLKAEDEARAAGVVAVDLLQFHLHVAMVQEDRPRGGFARQRGGNRRIEIIDLSITPEQLRRRWRWAIPVTVLPWSDGVVAVSGLWVGPSCSSVGRPALDRSTDTDADALATPSLASRMTRLVFISMDGGSTARVDPSARTGFCGSVQRREGRRPRRRPARR